MADGDYVPLRKGGQFTCIFHCKTLDEIKARYKQLAKQYHPDCGGDTATMQAVNDEYRYACAHAIQDENLSAEETEERVKLSEEYRRVLEQICYLPNIVIELVGNWIWVTGNTFPVKAKLREVGLFFASKKVAWYYRAEAYKTKGGKKTLEQIRHKYGSERIGSAARASKEIE